MRRLLNPCHRIARTRAGLLADTRGNVMMIMGFALLPLTFATGMVIDYSRAARLQTKINAIADAASLAAVTTPMMNDTSNAGCAAVRRMFVNQVANIPGLVMNVADTAQLAIAVTDNASVTSCATTRLTTTSSYSRVSKVTWSAKSRNSFASVLGLSAIEIGGVAQSKATAATNIDYFVLLDSSSSMALPTTTAGINFLKSRTVRTDYIWNPNGCAFACHQSNPDNPNVRDSSGKMIDYYTLAHLNGVELRIDAGKHAIVDMIDRAKLTMAAANNTYRFSVSTFDTKNNFKNIAPLTANLDTAKAQAATAETVAVAMHAWNYDRQTEPWWAWNNLEPQLPKPGPGNGSKLPGDTPQGVLVMVTDGLQDEEYYGRIIGPFPTDQCTALKARGFRIAVLYTTYQPESINYDGWSIDNVLWRLPQIRPPLESCATPGLFFEVSTDQSISDAMKKLFDATVQTARVTQ